MDKQVVEYYKALANPVRLSVFLYIAEESEGSVPSRPKEESCVTAISRALKIPQPTVSNHLRVLKEAGLVKSLNQDTHCYQYVNKHAADLLLTSARYFSDQAHKNPY
jgi:DNA-binding transcriptional ArsR family regulator